MATQAGKAPPHELPLVLVVEDDPAVARLLAAICAAAGARAAVAPSKAEALILLRTERPALVTLEMELPDGDGLDVARAIKAHPKISSAVPAIAISSKGTEADALAAGCIAYVEKPFDGAALKNWILDLLASGRGRERGS